MAGAATEGIWWQAWLCQVETLMPPRSAGVEPHTASCPAQPAEPNTKQGGRMNLTHQLGQVEYSLE